MSQVCRYCHGTIIFVRLDSGKPIPVEPIPSPDKGNVAAQRLPSGRLTGYVISRDKPLREGFERYLPHQANCKPDKPRATATKRAASLFD